MKRVLVLLFIIIQISSGQNTDSVMIRAIFSEALSNHTAYENLEFLCKNAAPRMPASSNFLKAVDFVKNVMKKMALDSVYLQEVMVPDWKPGNKQHAAILSKKLGNKKLAICPLGYSTGTGDKGFNAQLVEVKNFKELESIGKKNIQGKIIFYNRPMDPTIINTMQAYIGAVDQRVYGAIEAAKYDAKGVIVRSITTRMDDFPHTGVMRYKEGIKKIPAVAVSTNDAEVISKWLKDDPDLRCEIVINCTIHPDVQSYNVIGEIRGTKKPDEIIVVGGHLDTWFNTEGAHDDGSGCIHAIEVMRLFKKLHIKPVRTIRCVLFNDEEIMQTGGKKYAEMAKMNHEKHLAAIESDRGGLSPRGFTIDAADEIVEPFIQYIKYFKHYDILKFIKGFGGVDIKPLQEFHVPLIGLLTDPQRYFDYHHCLNDTFDKVQFRELQMGSAAIASLVYLIDKYGLE